MKRHFMKWDDNALEGDIHYGDYFLFSTNRFQLFFVSKMSAEESLMEKLQMQSREKLLKLKKEQKIWKSNKNLPLQSRSPKRGPPFSSPIYSSSHLRNLFWYLNLREHLKKKIKWERLEGNIVVI